MTILVFSNEGIVGDRKISHHGMVVDMMDKISDHHILVKDRPPLHVYLAGIGSNAVITKASVSFLSFINATVESAQIDKDVPREPMPFLDRVIQYIAKYFEFPSSDTAELNVVLRHGGEMRVLTLNCDGILEQRILPFVTGHESAVLYTHGVLAIGEEYNISTKNILCRAVELADATFFPSPMCLPRGKTAAQLQQMWFYDVEKNYDNEYQ